MSTTVRAIEITEFGNPEDVIRLGHRVLPALSPSQVLVRMQAAPINPADLNVIQGNYPIKPELPAVLGNEGVGIVEKAGLATTGLRVGQQVITPARMGSWCEAYVAEGSELYPIPPQIQLEQAALLSVNPATAYRLLYDFRKLSYDDWIIQNAANSSVGHYVVQLAKAKGFRTINLVRRKECIEPLKAAGADVVAVVGENAAEQIKEETKGAAINLGINATGGSSLKELAKCLSPGASLITIGAMSKEPFTLSNAQLIFRNLHCTGFWVTNWYQRATSSEISEMLLDLSSMVRQGTLQAPIEKTYSLGQAKEAIQHASQDMRSGKILFKM